MSRTTKPNIIRDNPRAARFFATLIDLRKPLIAISVFMSVRYLVWRAASTLNTATPLHAAISFALLAAEVYGCVSVFLFYFQARQPVGHKIVEVPERSLPAVDVFITIYNEPLHVLHVTLVACAALDYPRDRLSIYVLDDGPRDSVREMAAKYGCRYLTRPDRRHAKAGSLNNALRHSRGEFILSLDCDHVPVRSFLRETIGYFQDSKVAFVQTAQHFYNPDIFQHNLHLDNELVHEQDLFFQVIEPGRERTNSVMFAGTSAVLRRAALDSIGGIQTICAIEDTHTSMRLQAKGWKGIYHNRAVSAGLSPESYSGYLTQRMRWARGGIQLFVLDNPLLCPGLSLAQRLSYFSSILYFFHGWARLVFLLIPLAFLYGNTQPVISDVFTLMTYFLPHYVFAHLAALVICREFRNPFWSDVYEAASAFSLSWTALVTVLHPNRLIFKVTPKGEAKQRPHQVHWLYVLPHTVLLVLLLAGVILATRRMASYGLKLDLYSLSCLWASFNSILLGCAIEGTRERPNLRAGYRVHRSLAAELRYHGRRFNGVAAVLGESGALVQLETDEHLPPVLRIHIYSSDYDRANGLSGEMTELDGEVVHQDIRGRGSWSGIKFTDMTPQRHESLLRQMFSAPDSWDEHERPFVGSLTAMAHIVSSLLRPRMRKPRRARRARARIHLNQEAVIRSGSMNIPVRMVGLSVIGATIRMPPMTRLPERVALSFLAGEQPVEVRCLRVHETRIGARQKFALRDGRPVHCGLKFLVPEHLSPAIIEELENATS
ncbi:MAG: glycosyltransferase [Elusimicrobia bacterium]|nr:glycosyltransferase [Elusimicrobiota bacterium]